MYCKQCGKEIPNDSEYCNFCGAGQNFKSKYQFSYKERWLALSLTIL